MKLQSLGRLIFALGIRGVGEVSSNDLAATFGDLDNLSKANTQEIESIEGFGPNIADEVTLWFKEENNLDMISRLKNLGFWPTEEINLEDGEKPFTDMTFVVTGTLEGYTRTEIKSFIQVNGGKLTSSISKKTSYLVLGENPGSKLDKAKNLGTKIISVIELLELPKKL